MTNAFFLSGDNIATLSLDLTDAPRPERLTVAQILALAAKRMARSRASGGQSVGGARHAVRARPGERMLEYVTV